MVPFWTYCISRPRPCAPQFDTLTDLADQLLESGDMDVYGMTREDLERATSLLAPAAGAPGPSGAAGAAADDDMDIFGDDAEDTKDAEVKGAAEAGGNEAHAEPGMAAQGAAQPATGAAGVVPGGVGTGGAQVQTAKDFEHWPVKVRLPRCRQSGTRSAGLLHRGACCARWASWMTHDKYSGDGYTHAVLLPACEYACFDVFPCPAGAQALPRGEGR